jgi:hypothetical protein
VTNSEVKQIIAQAASRGIVVSDNEAIAFLGARELLQRDAGHRLAREVVENLARYIGTGQKPWSFAEFMLPDFEVAP